MRTIEAIFDEMLNYAISNRCTDIHFNLKESSIIFRRHKSRILVETNPSIESIYRHLKYKAKIEMASITNTKTGSFQYMIQDIQYYLRFSILETMHQRHGVLRILNIVPINSLKACGLSTFQIDRVTNFFNQNHGLILFCGKTGAGKSTTMYAALSEIEHKEIFTLENPIERYYPEMIQIESKNKELHDHVTQLLRHDPDILAIGEVRTSLELEAIVRASLSGHLITSTLHAGSIDEVLLRIENLNFSKMDIKTILRGIIFQKVYVEGDGFKFEFEIIEF